MTIWVDEPSVLSPSTICYLMFELPLSIWLQLPVLLLLFLLGISGTFQSRNTLQLINCLICWLSSSNLAWFLLNVPIIADFIGCGHYVALIGENWQIVCEVWSEKSFVGFFECFDIEYVTIRLLMLMFCCCWCFAARLIGLIEQIKQRSVQQFTFSGVGDVDIFAITWMI